MNQKSSLAGRHRIKYANVNVTVTGEVQASTTHSNSDYIRQLLFSTFSTGSDERGWYGWYGRTLTSPSGPNVFPVVCTPYFVYRSTRETDRLSSSFQKINYYFSFVPSCAAHVSSSVPVPCSFAPLSNQQEERRLV